MEVKKILRRLRFTQKFKPVQVSMKTLFDILDAGRWSYSYADPGAVEFILIKNPEKLNHLGKSLGAIECLKNAAHVVAICVNKDRLKFNTKENINDKMVITEAASSMLSMVVAARDYGLASAIFSIFDEEEIRKMLNCPRDVVPVYILAIGYPAEFTEMKRPPLLAILHVEEFGIEYKFEIDSKYKETKNSSDFIKLFS